MESNRIAKFEKVSLKQFIEDLGKAGETLTKEEIVDMYETIKLPKRATIGSAGYDFYAPFNFMSEPGEEIKIPTGIRCHMDENWVLQCYPRSGLGFKYQAGLSNTVGIIDSDYYYSDNEGHIQIKLVNRGNRSFAVEAGNGFAQGIFTQYGITVDDEVTEKRNGGFGSTTGK